MHKLISKFHLFIIILFLSNSYFVQVHSKPLPERILIPNKSISKYDSNSNNSIPNSKAGINLTNFILKRKLDNFTNNNEGFFQNITDKSNNKETNMSNAKNNGTKKNDDKTNVEEDPGTYLISFFVLFVFIGLYMICKMKDFKETKNKTDDVWKFLFFANNGAFLGSIINILFSNNTSIDYTSLALCGIIFAVGSIYFIVQYIKKCNHEYALYYFSCEKAEHWFKLPCFIISLIGLTDPCCRSNSYTETEYKDGHKESTYCCHCTWNIIIYIIKRFALFITIFSYYIFLIFLLIFWALAFLIYRQLSSKKQNKDENSNSNAQTSGNNDTQTSGNNDTQTNSTNNNGINVTVKNQLDNTEQINEISNCNLNNGEINNQNIIQDNNYPINKEKEENNEKTKSETSSIKSIKEYFNQPNENKNNKFGIKSTNVNQMNANGNLAQNGNNPGIKVIPQSIAAFY